MNVSSQKSTEKRKIVTGSPFMIDRANLKSRMKDFNFRVALQSEVKEVVSLGETLIDGKLAPYESVASAHNITGITVWVTGSPIDGLFLIAPLTIKGESAVRSNQFSPQFPSHAHLAGKGDLCGGLYVGVYAAASKEAGRAIMQASAILRVEIFGSVPCFARAATEDGARTMLSLGFSPADFGAPELYVQEALFNQERAA